MKAPTLTLGIEEEYQVVDPETGELTSFITEILEGDEETREQIQPELHQACVETASGVCANVQEAREEVLRMRRLVSERVAEKGKSHNLVQRAIRDTNHCGFAPDELQQAFDDLTDWVEYGVRPEGDAILDPATVASPDFGCAFTTVDRPGLPPCPVP